MFLRPQRIRNYGRIKHNSPQYQDCGRRPAPQFKALQLRNEFGFETDRSIKPIIPPKLADFENFPIGDVSCELFLIL